MAPESSNLAETLQVEESDEGQRMEAEDCEEEMQEKGIVGQLPSECELDGNMGQALPRRSNRLSYQQLDPMVNRLGTCRVEG